MRKIIWSMLNALHLGPYVQLALRSQLIDNGWARSFRTKRAEDREGNPLPWCTYSFIRFIDPRLHKEMSLFEYGCGNSTRWYAQRVGQVWAVEHDARWVKQIEPRLPANAKLFYQGLEVPQAYASQIHQVGQKFDVVVVDGRDRVNCVNQALLALKPEGVVVFDNSQLPQYDEAMKALANFGFRRIDFTGFTPIIAHDNTTSIFYRPGNCLGI